MVPHQAYATYFEPDISAIVKMNRKTIESTIHLLCSTFIDTQIVCDLASIDESLLILKRWITFARLFFSLACFLLWCVVVRSRECDMLQSDKYYTYMGTREEKKDKKLNNNNELIQSVLLAQRVYFFQPFLCHVSMALSLSSYTNNANALRFNLAKQG